MKARKWVLAKIFEGFPKDSDLQLVEEDLPELGDGDVLFEAVYASVDPYMRSFASGVPVGSLMIGQQVARVTKSKNKNYQEGQLYAAALGWRDKTVINPDTAEKPASFPLLHPAYTAEGYPLSVALGVLGMPGLTAYFGLLRICNPKPGETVFVNSAAGIVGSMVGQIAKIKGCRVIGCAGSDDKCKWLTSELGFDYVFNYKTQNVNDALKEGAPKGIDCYFDNVGGDMTMDVIQKHMNQYGRIACCGALSGYNSKDEPTGPHIFWIFIAKELKMQGFLVYSYVAEIPSAIADLKLWVEQGKIKVREEVIEGFENMRSALYGLLKGDYKGKVIVKILLNKMKARKWILVHHFDGFPKDSDLELTEEDLPELSDGDVLFEAVYASIDHYMRPYGTAMPDGILMAGQQIARVVKSKNHKYQEGQLFTAAFGWRDKTVINPDTAEKPIVLPLLLPAYTAEGHPVSIALGALGTPALTAYFGLMRICDPKPGETVFVNGAAGIVGRIVGQIAKIKGCRVIGCAGSDEKCKWLTSELGFDYAFNYKTENLSDALTRGAPNGIDCYFDNVGGDMTIDVIQKHMNRYGRIACCGLLSSYDSTDVPSGPHLFWTFIAKELKMQGYMAFSYLDEIPSAIADLKPWVEEGKLKVNEDVIEGFENMRSALYGLLKGNYSGKVVVKI